MPFEGLHERSITIYLSIETFKGVAAIYLIDGWMDGWIFSYSAVVCYVSYTLDDSTTCDLETTSGPSRARKKNDTMAPIARAEAAYKMP